MPFEIRSMTRDDWDRTAHMIRRSLNGWYLKNRGFELVAGGDETMLLFPRVYEALDPGCALLAVDTETGRIAGSCFYHPRERHVSLGMMNVDPDYFGHGAGSAILREITCIADKLALPLRLVSSAMNLDSFALYNRYGFVPTHFYQDTVVEVPDRGFPLQVPDGMTARDAQAGDIEKIARLEESICGIRRQKDWRFFFENKDRIWGLSVLEDDRGELRAVCASVLDPGSHMIGPAAACSEEECLALILRELNRYPGNKPVCLVPSGALKIRQHLARLGARLCETHIAQVRGEDFPVSGIVIPSFMPETA
ncbi:MAG: GNAT family N-acetyltransferase [Thermoguttaceae bacterium]|nr:GNAT family N-acetyltransferase [Thermoguttaceae bacterium]